MTESGKVEELKKILQNELEFEKHTSITFESKLTITTSRAQLTGKNSLVKINVNSGRGFLSISFISDEIDFLLFPKEIKVLLKDIEFVDDQYLKIAGFNFVNRNIGNYLIIIVPI